MDYTLVHYRVDRWEEKAYTYIKEKLIEENWPVERLEFQPTLMVRGLIIDMELGNVVKADRFGYVKRAFHGTKPMRFAEQRQTYASRTLIDLSEPRYRFLNTMFSLSEACIYSQLVELLDKRVLPGVMGYADLSLKVRRALDEAHFEGQLKSDIAANPDEFVDPDPDTPIALLDQKMAGKKLVLITNSEWKFTDSMLTYSFDKYLPNRMKWRELFDVVIVSARKPGFFSSDSPVFEVVNDGFLKPVTTGLRAGGIYAGGSASLVEDYLELSGDEILYVGDHIWVDVTVSKAFLRWRTAAVLRELESDIAATERFRERQQELDRMMTQKERLERKQARLRLQLQRRRKKYQRTGHSSGSFQSIDGKLAELRSQLTELDARISPLAAAASKLSNPNWGLLMRAGNDKSHLARQVERSADIYLSRVSNFLFITPFAYLRSPGGSLPHDPL